MELNNESDSNNLRGESIDVPSQNEDGASSVNDMIATNKLNFFLTNARSLAPKVDSF